MHSLFLALIIPILIALLIGVATGKWIWARSYPAALRSFSEAGGHYHYYEDELAPEDAEAIALPPATAPRPGRANGARGQSKRPKGLKPRSETKKSVVSKSKRKPSVRLSAIGLPVAKGAADDLLQIKGIGPKLNAVLIGLGISRFDQIAAWSDGDIAKLNPHLGKFSGRLARDQWVHQASLLAVNDIAGFEARYGTLDSENR
jgi:predicted flap endonuclease-1-like 5' DNA nuclease